MPRNEKLKNFARGVRRRLKPRKIVKYPIQNWKNPPRWMNAGANRSLLKPFKSCLSFKAFLNGSILSKSIFLSKTSHQRINQCVTLAICLYRSHSSMPAIRLFFRPLQFYCERLIKSVFINIFFISLNSNHNKSIVLLYYSWVSYMIFFFFLFKTSFLLLLLRVSK